MKRLLGIGVLFIISAALLIFSVWPFPNTIRHYTSAELVGLTCAELSEKHEEVITAYHDASIAHIRKTGDIEGGLGLPLEKDLPLIIVLTAVIREKGIEGLDLNHPFFHSASAPAPKQHSEIYAEFSALCASYPEMAAAAAVLQTAETQGLKRQSASLD